MPKMASPTSSIEKSTCARLWQFTKPALLLWGDEDRFFTIDLAYRLDEAFCDSGLVEISCGRTFFPLDEPQRVADEIQSAFQPRR